MTRFFDVDTLKKTREKIIEYLRYAYVLDAVNITETAQDWQSSENLEGQIAILNVLEVFLRDLLVYRSTQNKFLITNADQLDVIKKFCETLSEARLEDMIEQVNSCKPMVYRNVQPKLIFTALAFRFASLMRDQDPAISEHDEWKHLPHFLNHDQPTEVYTVYRKCRGRQRFCGARQPPTAPQQERISGAGTRHL
ncbi:MAG: DNA polymerase III subunit delta' C-terminal domain-containing protein [Fodinibius sp.]|nr:DNA polymerase III subunit delta' C-terminal domain-containing protein [Fodinibius sp.]